jgi:putative membrane protein
MRLALVLSLVLAIAAVVFALQNPGATEVQLGPSQFQGSTALILMVTFCLGVVVGILATVPSIVKRRKRIRALERGPAETTTPGALGYEKDDTTFSRDYRTE